MLGPDRLNILSGQLLSFHTGAFGLAIALQPGGLEMRVMHNSGIPGIFSCCCMRQWCVGYNAQPKAQRLPLNATDYARVRRIWMGVLRTA